MSDLIVFADAHGVLGFASECPSHVIALGAGPDRILRKIVQKRADVDGARPLRIPNFSAESALADIIAFSSTLRSDLNAARREAAASPVHLLTLEDRRDHAAQMAYEDFDFGCNVAGDQGWEHTVPGSTWERQVFLDTGKEGAPSRRGVFVVVFKPDAEEIASTNFYPLG